jgi:hypothetical protein
MMKWPTHAFEKRDQSDEDGQRFSSFQPRYPNELLAVPLVGFHFFVQINPWSVNVIASIIEEVGLLDVGVN